MFLLPITPVTGPERVKLQQSNVQHQRKAPPQESRELRAKHKWAVQELLSAVLGMSPADLIPPATVPLPTMPVPATTGLVRMETAMEQERVIRQVYPVPVRQLARVKPEEDAQQEVVWQSVMLLPTAMTQRVEDTPVRAMELVAQVALATPIAPTITAIIVMLILVLVFCLPVMLGLVLPAWLGALALIKSALTAGPTPHAPLVVLHVNLVPQGANVTN